MEEQWKRCSDSRGNCASLLPTCDKNSLAYLFRLWLDALLTSSVV